jgi:hypothetical protein
MIKIKRIFNFFIVVILFSSCSEKETNNEREYIREYCTSLVEYKAGAYVGSELTKTSGDTLRYEMIFEYFDFLENKSLEERVEPFPIYKINKIDSLFDLSRFFNENSRDFSLEEHYLILVDMVNDLAHQKISYIRYHTMSTVEVLTSKDSFVVNKDQKDSVLVCLNYFNVHGSIKNIYQVDDSVYTQRGHKFYVNTPSGKRGANNILGRIKFMVKDGSYDSLNYNIKYIVE